MFPVVVQETFPAPSVLRTFPSDPSVVGNVKALLNLTGLFRSIVKGCTLESSIEGVDCE